MKNSSLLFLLALIAIVGSFFLFQKDPQQSEAALTVNSPTPNNASITDGLVGHWTFDGPDVDWSDTNAEIKDRSGNGNDGDASTSGMNETNATPGKIGQGLNFNGTSDYYVAFGDGDLFDPPGATGFAVAVWAKAIRTPSNVEGVVGNGNASTLNQGYGFGWADSTHMRFWVSDGTDGWYGSSPTAVVSSPEDWHHYVGQWDGSATTLYIDGEEAAIDSFTGSYGPTTDIGGTFAEDYRFNIGRQGSHTGANDIDDVRVYNRTLSGEEILQLYILGR